MSTKWFVQLGEAEWARFTHARQAPDELRLLGSIRRDAQMGALAVDAEGRFFQVNGDHITPLSQSQVAAAVRRVANKLAAGSRQGGMRRAGPIRRPQAPGFPESGPASGPRSGSAGPAAFSGPAAPSGPADPSDPFYPRPAATTPAKPPVIVVRRRKTLEIQ